MNRNLILLIILLQILSIRSQESCCITKEAVEKYCPEGYSCCDCNECCSSTEFCASSHCVSYLLVIFGPASVILFILAIWMNMTMNKKEKQYRLELQKLSEPDAQIQLPNQEDESIEESEKNNSTNNQIVQNQNKDQIINYDDGELTAPPLKFQTTNQKNNDETVAQIQNQLKQPLINKENREEDEIEEQKNNNEEEATQQQQRIQFNNNPNNNQNSDQTYDAFKNNQDQTLAVFQQNDDQTYAVFKKND